MEEPAEQEEMFQEAMLKKMDILNANMQKIGIMLEQIKEKM